MLQFKRMYLLQTPRKNLNSGFTIVELLVVIVVIAILASVTVVGYNGIQNRATTTVAKNDLRTIGTTLQLYKSETGLYPRTHEELLDALNNQPQTLTLGVTNTGSIASPAPKSFVYCYSDDGSNMWVAAWKPVLTRTVPVSSGAPVYYWSNGNLGEAGYNEIEGGAGHSLCHAASSGAYSGAVWSYSEHLLTP